MIIKEQISKFFFPNQLNTQKEQELYQKAIDIRNYKNYVSKEIHSDILNSSLLSKFDFIKKFSTLEVENLSGKDKEWAIVEVMSTYRNEFSRIKSLLKFDIFDKVTFTYYKRNTPKHKRGDVLSYEIKHKSTPLSKTLSFLSRYASEGIISYIRNKKDFQDENVKMFYKTMIEHLEKYGEKRLLQIAISKRNRILKSIRLHNFNSLSFKSQTRIQNDIYGDNKNKKSILDGFITVGGYKNYKKGLNIPIKLSNKYHGKNKSYSKTYIVQYDSFNKLKRIIITKEVEKDLPEGNLNYIGVDLNIKNNLFTTSDGDTIDYDRNLMGGYIKFLEKLDNRKSKSLSKKRKKKYEFWQTRIQNHILEKTVELIKLIKSKGGNHIILEDLDLISSLKSKNLDFNINNGRLIRLLNLSSIKHKIRRIAHRYGMNVSFVQSEYTSQCCPLCGNIDSDNRKTQEDFICTSCGHSLNADHNSAINIRNRVLADVLRDKLLSFDGVEWNCKDNLGHDKIKNIIFDFFNDQEGYILKRLENQCFA
jgi:IS605 OrfB family transposase